MKTCWYSSKIDVVNIQLFARSHQRNVQLVFTNSPAAETRLHWTRQKSTPGVARRRKVIEGKIYPLWNNVYKLELQACKQRWKAGTDKSRGLRNYNPWSNRCVCTMHVLYVHDGSETLLMWLWLMRWEWQKLFSPVLAHSADIQWSSSLSLILSLSLY